jgi:hypothetical protein
MIMKRLLTPFLILFPVAASAQEGAVLFDRAVQYDFEVPEALPAEYRDLIPSANSSSMLLLFDESASLMIPAPTEEEAALSGMESRAQGLTARLKMGSPSRSDQESLLEAYVSYEDGTIAETREFMGRTFLISGTRERILLPR